MGDRQIGHVLMRQPGLGMGLKEFVEGDLEASRVQIQDGFPSSFY